MRYLDHLRQFTDERGQLNDFLALRGGRLIFGGVVDLLELAGRHGAPLEVALCPQITRRVREMRAAFAQAAGRTGYRGGFVYAYATKANFAREATATAVVAGAHYETSSAFDVRIARRLWQEGLLPPERLVLCNGSKEPPYLEAILELRTAGFANVVPVLDDPQEFEALAACPAPLQLGVRERKDEGDLVAGATYGYDRFGMLPEELVALARRVAETHHRIVLYHSMVGSQLDDSALFVREILESLAGFALLKPHAPDMTYFDFGGGVPTGAYSLNFAFDYAGFAEELQRMVGEACDARGIPHPHLVGEFGRYTVADHGAHVFRLGRIKRGHPGAPPWYLLDGSLMVALPDILIVKGQQFICLALNHLDAVAGPVTLGGRRTCDSDDFYPRTGAPPLVLPLLDEGANAAEPLLLAFFGTGAYQSMLSGEGGAHHCLAPEAPKLVIEERAGALVTHVTPEQTYTDVLAELGYGDG
ncbi:MAG TPA: arginine decarboxylase [Roseiflexaceae bacterium]|nr:arginine decarboxylase [Roseiflexaceae bacterium]